MTLALHTPATGDLAGVVAALRRWQRDDLPLQLHPGDLGWFWRAGADATAAALRVWTRGPDLVALVLLDGPDIARVALAPEAWTDRDVATAVVADLVDPGRGVLPAGRVSVESPDGTAVREALADAGWAASEAWSPLRLDLAAPIVQPDLRVETVGPAQVSAFTAVHRSAWGSPRFTDDVWRTMAAGAPFADAHCLLARDDRGTAVAGVTLWPAGPGRPGLLEPLGVHAEHRGHGYARDVCLAAAAVLREAGAPSLLVCTPSSSTGAVATYRAAGFAPLPQRLDRTRPD